MKKKYYLYIILGVVFATTIIPGVFMWLGIATPANMVANGYNAVFGDPNGLPCISIITDGVLLALMILGATK